MLVTSNNFVQLFFGWEGVGICSYLLISFWFTRVQAIKAGFKAVLMNKIGDIFFLLGMMVCYRIFKTLNFSIVFTLAGYLKDYKIIFLGFSVTGVELMCICFLIGAMAKSAQMGLHTWLADAMEGPTPVSALIHAATMVTAGVFLIIRCSPVFEYAPYTLLLTTFIGGVTAFSGATIALVQYDVKKIIAFSTMSQLGYMFFAAGLSAYNVSLYHLFNHAFFKALLFLSAGSLIHAMSDEQDIRKMGGLCKILPVTYVCFMIGTLSLIGFPFTSGFFSKESILNQAFAKFSPISLFVYILGVITVILTTFYSIRLLWWVFLSKYNGYKSVIVKAKESNFIILTPMITLSVLTIFSGFMFKDVFLGKGSNFFKNSIFIHKNNLIDNECIPVLIKMLPVVLTLVTILVALHISVYDYYLTKLQMTKFRNLHQFLFNRYHIDTIYNSIALWFLNLSFTLYKMVDQRLIEIFGPNLIRNVYGYLLIMWKNNLTNSNTSLFIQLVALIVSVICVTLGVYYFL
jgi:NADH-quinone oxidoreductase subunit L